MFSLSKYTREFGSVEKIKNFVDCYLDMDCDSEDIELLLYSEKLKEFTYAAVVNYLQDNEDFYINFFPGTSSSFRVVSDFCRHYREFKNKENFFTINRKGVYDIANHKILFKKIKCIWIFYELLKLLRNKKKTENIYLPEVNKIIAQKIQHFKLYHENTISYRDILGISDIENLLSRDVGSGKKRVTKKRKLRKLKRGKRTRAYIK
jgi:hypothetical protein